MEKFKQQLRLFTILNYNQHYRKKHKSLIRSILKFLVSEKVDEDDLDIALKEYTSANVRLLILTS